MIAAVTRSKKGPAWHLLVVLCSNQKLKGPEFVDPSLHVPSSSPIPHSFPSPHALLLWDTIIHGECGESWPLNVLLVSHRKWQHPDFLQIRLRSPQTSSKCIILKQPCQPTAMMGHYKTATTSHQLQNHCLVPIWTASIHQTGAVHTAIGSFGRHQINMSRSKSALLTSLLPRRCTTYGIMRIKCSKAGGSRLARAKT